MMATQPKRFFKQGNHLSTAVEMALNAVTSRPVEPVMLTEPMRPDQLPLPPWYLIAQLWTPI